MGAATWQYMAVDEDDYREVIVATEGMKEDRSSWSGFLHPIIHWR